MWAGAQDDPPQPRRGVLGGNTIPGMGQDLSQSCFYRSHRDFTAGVVFSADGLYGGFILLMCNTAQKKKTLSFASGLWVVKYQLCTNYCHPFFLSTSAQCEHYPTGQPKWWSLEMSESPDEFHSKSKAQPVH